MTAPVEDHDTTSDSYIFGTLITIHCVEKHLQEFFNTTSTFGKHRKVVRLGVGEGFLSVVARIYPDWTPSNKELPETIIAKIPNIMTAAQFTVNEKFDELLQKAKSTREEFLKSMSAMITRGHNAEVSFYKMITKHKVKAKIPKLYFGEQFSDKCKQGLLLMQDIGTGCAVSKPYEVLSVEEIKQVLKSLAIIHAFSMNYPESLKISQISLAKAMEEFADKDMYSAMISEIKKNDADLMESCDTILKHNNILKDLSILEKVGDQCGLPPILVHGDLWSSNVMWRKTADGSRELAGIIDWQVIHQGTPAEDIIRIISCTMSTEDRRQHVDGMLLYYYNELENNYGKRLPFKLQQLTDSFLKIYAHGMIQILPILGPLGEIEVENKFPERKEELTLIMKQKNKGLIEDIAVNLKLNYSP